MDDATNMDEVNDAIRDYEDLDALLEKLAGSAAIEERDAWLLGMASEMASSCKYRAKKRLRNELALDFAQRNMTALWNKIQFSSSKGDIEQFNKEYSIWEHIYGVFEDLVWKKQ